MYGYKENINVITTPSGDKVITMNKATLTSVIVALYEGMENQKADGRTATAEATLELIEALRADEK